MKEQEIVTRRSFIGSTALAGAAATFPYVAKGNDLKSDTIQVAAVGLGGRGSGAIDQILSAPQRLGEKQGNQMQHQAGGCGRCFCRRGERSKENRRFQEEVRR